jgi:hypothetical protein
MNPDWSGFVTETLPGAHAERAYDRSTTRRRRARPCLAWAPGAVAPPQLDDSVRAKYRELWRAAQGSGDEE